MDVIKYEHTISVNITPVKACRKTAHYRALLERITIYFNHIHFADICDLKFTGAINYYIKSRNLQSKQ